MDSERYVMEQEQQLLVGSLCSDGDISPIVSSQWTGWTVLKMPDSERKLWI